jgi:hypothetical protein
VRAHVAVKGGLDSEGALADVALEGFLSCVDADMALQVRGLLKRLVAVLALMGMLVQLLDVVTLLNNHITKFALLFQSHHQARIVI